MSPETGSERVLVIGGTAILRPAVLALSAAGNDVVVLGRDRGRLDALISDSVAARGTGAVTGIRCDYLEVEALSKALLDSGGETARYVSALVYCPDGGSRTLSLVGRAVEGPIVLLLTSKWAAPDRPGGRAGYPPIPGVAPHRMRYVLLGWVADSSGNRWHSPEEISEAALRALQSGRDVKLGATRPWDSRPR